MNQGADNSIGHGSGVDSATIESARAYLTKQKRMLIGGKWVPGETGEMLESLDPATESIIAHIPAGTAADVDRAVKGARQAFETGEWPAMSARRRGELIWRLADLLERYQLELATIETLDNGGPLVFTTYGVQLCITILRYYAGMATKIYGQNAEISGDVGEFHAYTRPEPVGVVGLITPWNGPLAVVCGKIAPALAAGCTCVVKPAELTSLTALRLGELILEAGFPPGVVNIVTGVGERAGSALALHSDVDKISFTGSIAVGRSLIQAAAGNLKRLSLELGGKSPLIVFDDADLEAAIPGAAMAIFANSGQVCFAGSRLYAHAKIYEKLVSGVAEFGRRLRLGNGLDPATELGPLISREQRERVLSYIESGLSEGAELVSGGSAIGQGGYFVEPTVFANVTGSERIVREEIFGPVLVATPFTDIDDVVDAANATRYGLAAGIYTRDISKAHRIAKRLRAGSVWINCYSVLDASMPAGGFGESGWGRELGTDGIEAFLEKKAVFARL